MYIIHFEIRYYHNSTPEQHPELPATVVVPVLVNDQQLMSIIAYTLRHRLSCLFTFKYSFTIIIFSQFTSVLLRQLTGVHFEDERATRRTNFHYSIQLQAVCFDLLYLTRTPYILNIISIAVGIRGSYAVYCTVFKRMCRMKDILCTCIMYSAWIHYIDYCRAQD